MFNLKFIIGCIVTGAIGGGSFLYTDKLSVAVFEEHNKSQAGKLGVDVFIEHKESLDKQFSNIKNQLNRMEDKSDKKLDLIIKHLISSKK